jgi:hypothetical protein
LNATINPNGDEVSACQFEYGPTTTYGSSASCSTKPGSGETPVGISALLTGLAENTTYHFRISATNAFGTTLTSDQTFTTLASSASATTKEESKPAEATDGELKATASGGTGTVTVGQYGSDPGGTRLLGNKANYTDVYRSTESSFKKIEYKDCELNGAKTLYWFNFEANGGKGEWEEVSRQTYIMGSPACINVEVETSGTSPTVAQMTGTRFGVSVNIAPPEFGRCVTGESKKEGTKAIYKGLFSADTCLVKSEGKEGTPEGKYEWELEVFQKAPFKTKLTSGAITLESAVATSKVTCTGEASGGEYAGMKTVAGVVLTLTGCTRSGEKCSTAGRTAGEIVTKSLEGILGIEKIGSTSAKDKVALELYPVGKTGPLMEFSCAGTGVSVRGSVIVPVKPDKMSLTQALKFKATKGKQKPESFEGGPKAILEESFNGGTFEQTGLTAAITQTNAEDVEINSVF